MAAMFNANEIFTIGVQIEMNGRDFYTAAAAAAVDKTTKKLFADLAEWENKHVAIFEDMRARLASAAMEQTIYDPDNEMVLYLRAAAGNHVFVKNKDPKALAAGCKTAVDALNIAMNFEKDSVVYYAAARNVVAENLGRDDINKLLDEELTHITMLDRNIARIEKLGS